MKIVILPLVNILLLSTTFGVGSIGRWIATDGKMYLVEQKKIDSPVGQYLNTMPTLKDKFEAEKAILQRLLSQTSI